MKCIFCLLFFFNMILGNSIASQIPESLSLSLKTTIEKTRSYWSPLKITGHEYNSAVATKEFQRSFLLPSLTLDASYRNQSEVPELAVAGSSKRLSTHQSWAVGPTLNYVLFDGFETINSFRAASSFEKAKLLEKSAKELFATFWASSLYTQVALAAEETRLTLKSLLHARDRYNDVAKKVRAGILGRVDEVAAHKDVLDFTLRFTDARTFFATCLRELFANTGDEISARLLYPCEKDLVSVLPSDVEKPNLVVTLDSLDRIMAQLSSLKDEGPAHHPELAAMEALERSSRLQASAARGKFWPKAVLTAKIDKEYPFGPNPESFTQKSIALTISMPLFEWGRTSGQIAQNDSNALIAGEARRAKEDELNKSWATSLETYASLLGNRELSVKAVHDLEEIEKLTLLAFNAGKKTFLDVQTASLNLLQGRVGLARIKAKMVFEKARIDYLSNGGSL